MEYGFLYIYKLVEDGYLVTYLPNASCSLSLSLSFSAINDLLPSNTSAVFLSSS